MPGASGKVSKLNSAEAAEDGEVESGIVVFIAHYPDPGEYAQARSGDILLIRYNND
jgi:hypothetical protein